MRYIAIHLAKARFSLPLALLAMVGTVLAQTNSGTLTGTVTDPTGAVIPQAIVTITSSDAKARTTTADQNGAYKFAALASGKYAIAASAQGFSPFQKSNVTIAPGQALIVNIALQIAVEQQHVEVQAEGTGVSVAPENNASSVVLKGQDLDALSDDPDELQAELEAMAGPAAGPNGGQIYIDGFTGGQLPPKSAIREIRINQNPFSPQYDKLGYGRIEIFTKPGTDKLHGQFFFNVNNSVFNSTNPFLAEEPPPYQSEIFNGNVGGPLGTNASFFVTAQHRNINEGSAVNAIVLDQNFNPVAFTEAVPHPQTLTSFSPRIDLQLSGSNTLSMRYQFTQRDETNNSVGQFALASQGVNLSNVENTIQISDTQVLSPTAVNETRLQYMRIRNDQGAQSTAPEISVLGAFTGGGNPIGVTADHEDNLELQNNTQITRGTHTLNFGGRLRVWDVRNSSTQNFNGTFTFSSLAAYQVTEQGLQQGLSMPQIRALGGGASQFTLTTGQPIATLTYVDAGIYGGDDWRVRSNFTLSYGLRFETQNGIHDHGDWAPRVAIAWGLGSKKGPPKTVLRAGFGIFYDRFADQYILNAERLDGTTQEQFIVQNPDFYPTIPSPSSLTGAATLPTTYQVDPRLRAPYTMQAAVAIERQITKRATVAITYLNSRGVDQFLSRNINAPLPDTFDPANPASGIRPFGNIGNIYQYESEGAFKQNQLITNFNVRAGSRLSLFGYYTLNYADSNTSGPASFPSNQYNLALDYGRASFDVRHRVFLGGTLALPQGFRLSPLIVASSGSPYNITIGRDLNGDSIFNDRPAFADSSTTAPITTSLGAFDLNPLPGETLVPINYGTGPGQFTMNLRVSKSFSFGPETRGGNQDQGSRGRGGPGGGGGGPRGGLGGRGLSGPGGPGLGSPGAPTRRYQITLSAYARNLFNNVNPLPPIGQLTSPLFGKSNGLAGFGGNSAANRRIDLQLQFSF